jgi:formate hydrogenlyase subunit 3/multisubunit Na+/H+ antiporter MnhD subunit
MNAVPYFTIAIIVLVLIAALFLLANRKRKTKRLSSLAGLAFAFVLAGIFFGEYRLVGYGLMGVGVLLALIDIIIGLKSGSNSE